LSLYPTLQHKFESRQDNDGQFISVGQTLRPGGQIQWICRNPDLRSATNTNPHIRWSERPKAKEQTRMPSANCKGNCIGIAHALPGVDENGMGWTRVISFVCPAVDSGIKRGHTMKGPITTGLYPGKNFEVPKQRVQSPNSEEAAVKFCEGQSISVRKRNRLSRSGMPGLVSMPQTCSSADTNARVCG